MPIYSYNCECGSMFETFFSMKEDSSHAQCPKCDRQAGKILTVPRVRGDFQGYTCPITNKWIDGKRAHRENLARHGCRILEAGEHEEKAQRRRREEALLESEIDAHVEATLESMPTRQLEKLGEELSAGTDVVLTRK